LSKLFKVFEQKYTFLLKIKQQVKNNKHILVITNIIVQILYLYNIVSRKKARLKILIYTRFFILIQQTNKICKIKIAFI
jgi:hypothetical protein